MHVDTDRSRSQTECMIDILYRTEHVSTKMSKADHGDEKENDDELSTHRDHSKEKGDNDRTGNEENKSPIDGCEGDEKSQRLGPNVTPTAQMIRFENDPNPDDDPSDSDEESDEEGKRTSSTPWIQRPVKEEAINDEVSTYAAGSQGYDIPTGLGVNGRDLVKSFIGQTPFSGTYNEDLEETINVYQDFCDMCNVNLTQKRKAMTIMLKGPARAYFARHVRDARRYEEAVCRLRKRYNNREKRYRLFNEWQEMSLTRVMKDDPTASEIGVF